MNVSHMPESSCPTTRHEMRYGPGFDVVNVKVWLPPLAKPCIGSGVVEPSKAGTWSPPFLTIAHEWLPLPWFWQSTVTFHPSGIETTIFPLEYPLKLKPALSEL